MNPPVQWLREGEPWIEYRTRIDLMGQPEDEPEVRRARKSMLLDPPIRRVLKELAGWPGHVLSSHKSASQPFHKLAFIADLGLKARDPPIAAIGARILKHRSSEGPFSLPMNIPERYGGTGRDQWAWALCDAPLIVHALLRFGLGDKPEVRAASRHLIGLLRQNGWPCAVSKELGGFRGPGRKDDPCPFATLAMVKLVAEVEGGRTSEASRVGAETLLALWRESRERHPYQFYMGTDFRKLKAPLIWYDLVHVLDTLSRFPWLTRDERLRDMLEVLKGKADREGRFTVESVWTAWKDWEFGQKKVPSRWLTLLAWRIIRRIEAA